MSICNFKSFFEEKQKYYNVEQIGYIPLGYPEAGLRYRLTPKGTQEACPKCGCLITYAHEYKTRIIHAGTYLGVPVTYEMVCIRYLCRDCGATFRREYEYLPWYHGITTEAENYILWSLGSMPMSAIADEIGVCVQTIANRAIAFGKQGREEAIKGRYRLLSMDEVYIGRNEDGSNAIYWVLNDISTPWKANNIILGKGRDKADVIKQLKKLEHPEYVEAVCTVPLS